MRALLWTAFSAVLAYAQAGNADEAKWMRLNTEGIRLTTIPDYPAAEAQFRLALVEAERLGEHDYRLWATLSNLAFARQEQGDLAEAEKLYTRLAGLRQKYLGPEAVDVARALNNLAAVLQASGRPAEADPLVRRALLIAEHAGDERLIAALLNTLGLTLSDQGERARAEPVLRRSQALFLKSAGPDSLEFAKSENNLAMLYSAEGENGRAEAELARALPIYEKCLGSQHPVLATVLNNMFTVLAGQRRFDDAEPYLRRALAIYENTHREDVRLARMRSSLAALEAYRGNYETARKMLESVIEMEERVLGARHPELAPTLETYSAVLHKLRQKTEAKRAGDRANAILKSFR